jgi:hypothetical protein
MVAADFSDASMAAFDTICGMGESRCRLQFRGSLRERAVDVAKRCRLWHGRRSFR